jgi:uncharacterized membrane protein
MTAHAAPARRLLPVDALRGLIMVIMALDHASAFVARQHSSEFWGGVWTRYESAAAFLTRFVTHLCAPGFFFLMGAGLALFAAARAEAGWPWLRISRTVLLRGALLLVVSQFLEVPAFLVGVMSGAGGAPGSGRDLPPGMGSAPPYVLWPVLSALAAALILSAYLLRLPGVGWAGICAGALAAATFLIPSPELADAPVSLAATLLLVPGQTGHVFVLYPILPWWGITAAGVLFGRWLHRDRVGCLRASLWIGAGLLLAAGGAGNLRLPRDTSWIEFLNFIKYPPALVFTLFMVGGNLALLGLLARFPGNRAQRFLAVFGQTPLFFYLAHLWLYALLGAVFFRHGVSLPAMYSVWLASLAPLYAGCRWYGRFKAAKPLESVWRLF